MRRTGRHSQTKRGRDRATTDLGLVERVISALWRRVFPDHHAGDGGVQKVRLPQVAHADLQRSQRQVHDSTANRLRNAKRLQFGHNKPFPITAALKLRCLH